MGNRPKWLITPKGMNPVTMNVRLIEDFDPDSRPVTVSITFQNPSGSRVEYQYECRGVIADMINPRSLLDTDDDGKDKSIVAGFSEDIELIEAHNSLGYVLATVIAIMNGYEPSQ